MRPSRSLLLVVLALPAGCGDTTPVEPEAVAARETVPAPPSVDTPASTQAAPSVDAPPSAAPSAPSLSTVEPAPASGGVRPVDALAWDPQGGRIALARGGILVVRDLAGPGPGRRLGVQPGARSLHYSDDGAWLTSYGDDEAVRLWHVAEPVGYVVLESGVRDEPTVAFSHDGTLVALSFDDQAFAHATKVWRTATGALVPAATRASDLSMHWSLAFRAGDRDLAGFDVATLTIWDVYTGRVRYQKTFDTGATSPLTLSPDGMRLAVCYGQHGLVAGPVGGPEVSLDFARSEEDHLGGLRYSADSRTFTMRGASGRSAAWDARTWAPRGSWEPTLGGDQEAGFMAEDGSVVVHVRPDGRAEVLGRSGARRRGLDGHVDMAIDPSFSRDQRWIAQPGVAAAAWSLDTGARVGL